MSGFFDFTSPSDQPGGLQGILASLSKLSDWGAAAGPSRLPVPFGMAANLAHQQGLQNDAVGLDTQLKQQQVQSGQMTLDQLKRNLAAQNSFKDMLFAPPAPAASSGPVPFSPAPAGQPAIPPQTAPVPIPTTPQTSSMGVPTQSFDTKLTPAEESQFQKWKQKNAPNDSGVDYDLRGAFKAGLSPDPKTGHWPDTFKKPNHPTFSNQSQYAGFAPDRAGSWDANDQYIPPQTATPNPYAQATLPNGLKLPRGWTIQTAQAEYSVDPQKTLETIMAAQTPAAPIKASEGDRFLDPNDPTKTIAAIPDKPAPDPEIVRTAVHLFPGDAAKQNAYIEKNSASNLRAITNINNQGNRWQVVNDPTTGKQYRYNPETFQATTLDGQPYHPGGQGKLAGGGVARSPQAAIMQKYMQDNPNATADDLIKMGGKIREQISAADRFGSGPLGTQVKSFNVAISHLDTLRELGDALKNGDIKQINAVANSMADEFGIAAPNNFELAKTVVGDEIAKAIIAGVGSVTDRTALQDRFSRANSPDALVGVIKTAQSLMSGQVKGLKKQYENSTGLDDFNDKLFPRTRQLLGLDGPSSGADVPIGGTAPPPQQHATEADIQHTMQVNKMTRQQVLDGMKQRGISIAP